MKSALFNLFAILPISFIGILMKLPNKGSERITATRDIQRDIAGKLFDERWNVTDPENEAGNRDVMSLLGELL